MPYFADRGYDTFAISFRCQGSSDMQPNTKFAGTLASHSADIQHFVSTLPKPPVILAHSLGGLIAQRCAKNVTTPNLLMHCQNSNPTLQGHLLLSIFIKGPCRANESGKVVACSSSIAQFFPQSQTSSSSKL